MLWVSDGCQGSRHIDVLGSRQYFSTPLVRDFQSGKTLDLSIGCMIMMRISWLTWNPLIPSKHSLSYLMSLAMGVQKLEINCAICEDEDGRALSS
jgi:hypothetical protein